MIFTPDHITMILRGSKTQTRRTVKPGQTKPYYRVGRPYCLQRGRCMPSIGRSIEILAVNRERLVDITLEDARAEGHFDPYAFLDAWRKINGSLDLSQEVWAYRFKLLPVSSP